MLTISDEAADLICRLLAETDLPESAGLRLSTDPDKHSLAMNLAPKPGERDVVVEHLGASMFLEPTVVQRLRGQTLRAQIEERRAFFLT